MPDRSIAINRINLALSHTDPSWAFFRAMNAADANDMDKLLVERQHPLAFEAGTQWDRFQQLRAQGYRF